MMRRYEEGVVIALWASLWLAIGCSGPQGQDAQTAALKATLGKACASRHDCGGNQRCVEKLCELDANACVSNNQCGSRRCDSGFCGLPTPALLTDENFQQRQQGTPAQYLAAGRDGFVDARGGLVLAITEKIAVSGGKLWWHDWELLDWAAESADTTTWRPTVIDPNLQPERMVLRHRETQALLVAYVRPVGSQSREAQTAPLKKEVDAFIDSMKSGASARDALALKRGDSEAAVERTSAQKDRLEQLEAVRVEAVRALRGGGERLRLWIARLEFGGAHYVALAGLIAPADAYTGHLNDLTEFLGYVKFAGVDARVGTGL